VTKACAALGLGRIIEVEGRPYDPRYEGLKLLQATRHAACSTAITSWTPRMCRNAIPQWEAVASQHLLSQTRGLKIR
jgi:hypothetical protein